MRMLAVLLSLLTTFHGAGADWPQYRGATHDGVVTDRITTNWTGVVTNPVWRVVVPNCLASLSVSGGRVFTQARRQRQGSETEFCVALNATNGAELWAVPIDVANYPEGGVGDDNGPRTTPAIYNGSVYVASSYLKLYRLNAGDGSTNWLRDLMALYNARPISYQNCASPVIENDLIFLNANTDVSTLMALRTSDGSIAWRSQSEAMTHSTPVVTTISGVRQVIFATQSGLVSVDAQSGNLLWKVNYPFAYSTSIGASPVVYQDMVFITGAHAYEMGSVAIRATVTNNAWSTTQLWFTNNPAAHWMTPVAYQGFLFGHFGIQSADSPSAQLKCVDMRTGAVKWSANNFGRSGTLARE
jgi:outer membrane protein assembly factor BamB